MSFDGTIKQVIQKLSGVNPDQVQIKDAEVVSVELSSRTCTVQVVTGKRSFNLPGVRLMATVDDGLLMVPAIGSTVIIAYSTFVTPYISLFSEISRVLWVVGESSFEIKDKLIELNDGAFGGLAKVPELVQRINNLENFVNQLATKFDTHVHPGVQSGSSSTLVTATPIADQLDITQRSDIENTNVKHG